MTIRKSPRLVLASLLLASPFASLSLSADEPAAVGVYKNDGSLPGAFNRISDGTYKYQQVHVDDGLDIVLFEADFRQVLGEEEKMAQYRQLVSQMKDTADAHWEMSRWCNQQSLRSQQKRHILRVVELEPNHGPARQLLGYEPHENGWAKTDVLRRERGMVRDRGRWRYAEEVVRTDQSDEFEQSRGEWKRKLKGLKLQLRRSGPQAVEAQATINGIDDPAADLAVIEEFRDTNGQSTEWRLTWLDILGRLRTPASMEAIVYASMFDASATIREACFDILREHNKYGAITFYLSHLGSRNNEIVKLAGRALTELNDPEIALSLVEALKTKHEVILKKAGNQTNVGMSRDGGVGGLSTGGGDVKRTLEVENPEVLSALLETVEEDVNYLYDQDRWRIHFAMKMAPPPSDLRRDP